MPASLAGALSVEESARLLRHYRYAAERMMRVLGGWIALTPELSAKLLLGRHVWDNAQHCDALGKRLLELRSQAQVSEPSGPGVIAFMDALESAEAPGLTVERLVGAYRVLKPHLTATYEWHLARANPVYEPPTRQILERCIADERRHIAAGETVLAHLIDSVALRDRAAAWQRELESRLADAGGVSGCGLPPAATIAAGLDAEAEEFIRLERAAPVPPPPDGLAAALASLGDAIVDGHAARLDAWLPPGTPGPGALLPGARRFARHRVVAVARVGRQYMAKLRLDGPDGPAVLLTRWFRTEPGWRLGAAERIDVALPPSR